VAHQVGVRKVRGASVSRIVLLLSKDVLLLVGIAFIIAAPLAYFAVTASLFDSSTRRLLDSSTRYLDDSLAGRAYVPLVHVAPHPALARFDRLHDGVLGLLKVPRGVLVLRRVAAADVAARLAHP